MNIEKIKKVNIRGVWPHEAHNFTPWLAEQENIKILGEELDLKLEVVGTEIKVGKFSVDILCTDIESEDVNNPNNIIIENQYGKTDHDHLGKLITYGAGLEARVIIWIMEEVRDEHRSAIAWLNNHMPDIDFFLVSIEVWQIGDSAYGPKFNVLEKPDEWTRTTKKIRSKLQFSDMQQLRFDFWTKFGDWIGKKYPQWLWTRSYECVRTYYGIGISDKVGQLLARIDVKEKYISVARYSRIINDELGEFDRLFDLKDQIEKKLNNTLSWTPVAPGSKNKFSLIELKKEVDVNYDNQETWSELFQWYAENLEKLDSVLSEYF